MVLAFERRRNLHPLSLMIQSDPAKAKSEMIRAYKNGGYSHEGAAKALGVAESTYIRWVHRMNLWEELATLRKAAEKQGIVHPSRGPARVSAKSRRR